MNEETCSPTSSENTDSLIKGTLRAKIIVLQITAGSKRRSEFTALRNTEPKYTETLRAVMLLALVVAAIIATFFDIVKLTST